MIGPSLLLSRSIKMAFTDGQLLLFALLLLSFNFLEHINCISFNAIVASDGSGDFRTVGDAIAAAPNSSNIRYFIRVKPGIYHEHVEVPAKKTFIALIGDNAATTIIVDGRSNGTGFKTSDSATLIVKGANFMAQFLTFQNSAGLQKGQAVAVLDEAKSTTYYRCIFIGFQDTLYIRETLHFFKECDIYGSVDFIFGDGLVVFQDCNIYAQIPSHSITITAQSKEEAQDQSGFSFQNCTITASPSIMWNKRNVHVYLGRPWRTYSTVVYMECFLDDVVVPTGWMEWEGVPVTHLFYAEFNNRGPGANISNRINWPGYHIIDKQVALNFTVENFINGTKWLPETGVPFRSGFLP